MQIDHRKIAFSNEPNKLFPISGRTTQTTQDNALLVDSANRVGVPHASQPNRGIIVFDCSVLLPWREKVAASAG